MLLREETVQSFELKKDIKDSEIANFDFARNLYSTVFS